MRDGRKQMISNITTKRIAVTAMFAVAAAASALASISHRQPRPRRALPLSTCHRHPSTIGAASISASMAVGVSAKPTGSFPARQQETSTSAAASSAPHSAPIGRLVASSGASKAISMAHGSTAKIARLWRAKLRDQEYLALHHTRPLRLCCGSRAVLWHGRRRLR